MQSFCHNNVDIHNEFGSFFLCVSCSLSDEQMMGVLPILPLLFPVMWVLVNAYGEARVLAESSRNSPTGLVRQTDRTPHIHSSHFLLFINSSLSHTHINNSHNSLIPHQCMLLLNYNSLYL